MELLLAIVERAGFLPSAGLMILIYALLRAARRSIWLVALLALPGTISHELMHLIIGLVFQAKPRAFSIWPRRKGKVYTLGSVAFANIGLLNGALVTLAPLLLLPLAWLCLVDILMPLWVEHRWGWWLAGGYLAATALFAGLPSFQDLRVGASSILLYVAAAGLLLLAYIYM